MKRALLLTFAIACDAPGPPAPPLPSEYPLKLGLKWTYESPPGLTVVRELAEAEGPWLRMHYELSIYGTKDLWMRREGNRVLARGEGRDEMILRFPMRAGDHWEVDVPGYEEVSRCEVVGPEDLELPIGRVKTTKVNVQWRKRTETSWSTGIEWYAQGYGLVQMEASILGVTKIFRLVKFEDPR